VQIRFTRDLKKSSFAFRLCSASPSRSFPMQCDDVIWSAIGNQFCSYKVKYVAPSLCLREAQQGFPGQLRRISVETNTTSPASAAGNHVPLPILGMQPCVNMKVCTCPYLSVDMHPELFHRCPLPVHEDYRASAFPGTHVGKGQTVKQLHKSIGAGKPADYVQTVVY